MTFNVHPKFLKFHFVRIPKLETSILVLPRWHSGKEPTCQGRRHKRPRFDPWVRKIPWSTKWQLTPVFLPGKFQRWRSLMGYSLWRHQELDTTEYNVCEKQEVLLPCEQSVFPSSQFNWHKKKWGRNIVKKRHSCFYLQRLPYSIKIKASNCKLAQVENSARLLNVSLPTTKLMHF